MIEIFNLEETTMKGELMYCVEPMFKIGDFIKHNKANIICKVISVNSGSYYVENIETNGRIELFNAEQNFHLWNIQDAKDGDVLVCESGERTLECLFIFKLIADREVHEYCSHRTIDKHFSLKDSFLGYVDNVYHPATKEQRDLLFQKMKESGYKWDSKKKALMKIEQFNLTEFEDAVKDMMNAYRDAIGANDVTTEEVKKHAAYLLSLIPYKSAKWSEDDENILKAITYTVRNSGYNNCIGVTNETMRDWLTSIKQRLGGDDYEKK